MERHAELSNHSTRELSQATIVTWLRRSAQHIHRERQHLTELDAAIGDGDHGHNLDRGFRAIEELLGEIAAYDAGTLLRQAGMRLIVTVGGASGPLYGTALRQAGQVLAGRYHFTGAELGALLAALSHGVAEMGRAQLGDKTMLDVLEPASQAYRLALAEHSEPLSAIQRAATAATAAAQATVPLLARRGRASYLGERSIGHLDPGAASAALLIQALAEAVARPDLHEH